jgi:sugar phosphate isomerase/epimerase
VLEFAAALGAHTVVACRLEAGLDPARAADGFAALCALAAEHGLRICVEFLPWSGIADLATAWRLVTDAGAPNGGILIDTWHWVRQPGGPDLDLLARIPGERIHYVQLGRAADERAENLFAEAMTARLPLAPAATPAGEVVGALFATLGKIGADPYVAVEVFNTDLAATGPAAMAALLADTTAAGLPPTR